MSAQERLLSAVDRDPLFDAEEIKVSTIKSILSEAVNLFEYALTREEITN